MNYNDLLEAEIQLKQRWSCKYQWFRKQNDFWDRQSSFIYSVTTWDELNERIALQVATEGVNEKEFFQYCINRWYNFRSAKAVENIFTSVENVKAWKNPKSRTIDFSLHGINFDLKTSVFPAAFSPGFEFSRNYPEKLIEWLYKNQSSQGRKHFENRLFLIVYDKNGEHWKLKAEISWLKQIIEKYVTTFEASSLKSFCFQPGKQTLSDIIWAIK
ncbi:hypothetical protein [Salegentibacter chungangensis]|uniref:Uncharacterized protein n=1 Tax=Salegentibacter chungangensis TaxID=1335724 RepID=A0ABW3NMQ1_9FLAO